MALKTSEMDFSVGQIVQTYYGVGVVVQLENNEFYKVRLWRIPGKSLASGALAVLRPSAVSKDQSAVLSKK